MSADLPTPNTETRHTPGEIEWYTSNSHNRIGSCNGYVELIYAVVYADGVPGIEWKKDADAQRLIDCWNACASIPGDPEEGIRKAVEAIEWLIDDIENNCDKIELLGDNTLEGSWYHRLKDALSALKGESKS